MGDDSLIEQLSGVVEEEIGNDGLVEQLSGVVEEESMMLGKDAIGNSKEFGNCSSFSLQFCLDTKAGGGKIDQGKVRKGRELEQNKLKGIERLSHARENTPMSEFDVVLPISACYSLSLSWLLNWFPRPMVKLKFMIQNDEEMGSEGKVQWAPTKAEKDRIHVVVLEELGWLLDGDYDATGYDKISKEDNGELKEMRYGERGLGKTYGKRGTEGRRFVIADMKKVDKDSGLAGLMQSEGEKKEMGEAWRCFGNLSSDCLMIVRVWQVSVWDGEVKMKHMVVPVDSCRVFKGGGMTKVGYRQVQHGEVIGGVEGFNTWDNDQKFDLHYVPSLLNISLQALDVCAGGIVSLKQVPENIHQTIGRCETEKLQAGVHYAMEKPISYVHSDITALASLLEVHKEAKPQPLIVWSSSSPVYGLITKVTFSEVDRIDQPASLYVATKKADEEIAHTYNHNFGLFLSRLRFFTVYGLWERTDMVYFFFTRDILTWKSISIFEPGNDGIVARDFTYIDDIVKGCLVAVDTAEKSTGSGGKKTTHQLSDIGWLVSIWFPKPKVKMKLSKMRHKKLGSMIPCGQGILRGVDCYDHKLKKEKKRSTRNTPLLICTTTYMPVRCHIIREI